MREGRKTVIRSPVHHSLRIWICILWPFSKSLFTERNERPKFCERFSWLIWVHWRDFRHNGFPFCHIVLTVGMISRIELGDCSCQYHQMQIWSSRIFYSSFLNCREKKLHLKRTTNTIDRNAGGYPCILFGWLKQLYSKIKMTKSGANNILNYIYKYLYS